MIRDLTSIIEVGGGVPVEIVDFFIDLLQLVQEVCLETSNDFLKIKFSRPTLRAKKNCGLLDIA